MFICDRLQITGLLSYESPCKCKVSLFGIDIPLKIDNIIGTPLCVLNEILTAHGYQDIATIDNYQDIIDLLNSHHLNGNVNTISRDDLSSLASYINCDIEWTRSNLFKALNFIELFYINNKNISFHLNKILSSFDLYIPPRSKGSQTEKYPESLNCCMLYAICKHLSISLRICDSVDYMISSIKSCLSQSTLFNEALVILSTMNSGQLLSFIRSNRTLDNNNKDSEGDESKVSKERNHLIKNKMHLNSSSITHEDLSRSYKSFNDPKLIKLRIIPLDNTEAITLAAINFGVDITAAVKPLTEYLLLRNNGGLMFRDKHLKLLRNINPSFLMLSQSFNPLFPLEFYSQHIESISRKYFNINGRSKTEIYNELSTRYLLDDFYFGLQPEISNTQSLIGLNDLQEVKSNDIICYGVRNHCMTFYTFDELSNIFDHNKDFRIPKINRDGSISFFSLQSIEKLKIIAGKLDSKTRDSLISSISKVENANKGCSLITQNFKMKYLSSNKEFQEIITKTLKSLLDVSMYMRGWKLSGNGDSKSENQQGQIESSMLLPLVNTTYDLSKQGELEINVSREINNLDLYNSKCSSAVYNLPLVRWNSSGVITSNSKEEGLTIGERIQIIKAGNSVYSCIRLSSNWLASSAHYYMTVIGLPAPFEISKMRFIS